MFRALLIFLCLGQTASVWAALSVTSSQTQMLLTEQISVEIELDKASDSTPNLTQLSQDFSVLSFERMVLGQANRDHTEYRTRWQLSLRPRRIGELVIPSLSIDGSRSEPLSIRVSADPNQPLIIPTLTRSEPPYYVDQPILIEASFAHEKPLPPATQIHTGPIQQSQLRVLTELESQPSESGWISSQRFALYYPAPGTQPTPKFELMSAASEVLSEVASEVLEISPPAYQTERGGWLPAERLTLADSWDGLHRAQLNTELERTLTLTAQGPLSIQLPEFPLPSGFRRIDAQISESQDPFGIMSKRTETWMISTGASGDLQAEATELIWWDIGDQTTRILTIPARSLIIEQEVPTEPIQEEEPLLSNSQIQLLGAGAGLFGLTALLLLVLYKSRDRRNRLQINQLNLDIKILKSELKEARLFIALTQACERNQADAARDLLLNWIPYIWTDTDFESLDSLCLQSGDSQFNLVLFQLIDYLAHPEESDWDGESLAMQLKTLRRRYISAGQSDTTTASGDLA